MAGLRGVLGLHVRSYVRRQEYKRVLVCVIHQLHQVEERIVVESIKTNDLVLITDVQVINLLYKQLSKPYSGCLHDCSVVEQGCRAGHYYVHEGEISRLRLFLRKILSIVSTILDCEHVPKLVYGRHHNVEALCSTIEFGNYVTSCTSKKYLTIIRFFLSK